jgi:predicted glycoside hydrolase/deacetylase ChbG (UPF0249 family)
MSKTFAFSLCADDYAMTPGVSRGILEALDAGALSATSVMTTSPWWPESAQALRPHVGHADIGLHLNLTLGTPLGPMPVLAPDGTLPDIRTLLRLQRAKQLPLDEIAAEIDRQCERFATVFGRPPDHVDGHQHIQALRMIRPLVFEALDRRDWRPWLRDSSDRVWRIPWRGGLKKALALCVVAEGYGSQVSRRGFTSNDGFAGYSPFDPSLDYGVVFVAPSDFAASKSCPGRSGRPGNFWA